jgi:hypothetical protein
MRENCVQMAEKENSMGQLYQIFDTAVFHDSYISSSQFTQSKFYWIKFYRLFMQLMGISLPLFYCSHVWCWCSYVRSFLQS